LDFPHIYNRIRQADSNPANQRVARPQPVAPSGGSIQVSQVINPGVPGNQTTLSELLTEAGAS